MPTFPTKSVLERCHSYRSHFQENRPTNFMRFHNPKEYGNRPFSCASCIKKTETERFCPRSAQIQKTPTGRPSSRSVPRYPCGPMSPREKSGVYVSLRCTVWLRVFLTFCLRRTFLPRTRERHADSDTREREERAYGLEQNRPR